MNIFNDFDHDLTGNRKPDVNKRHFVSPPNTSENGLNFQKADVDSICMLYLQKNGRMLQYIMEFHNDERLSACEYRQLGLFSAKSLFIAAALSCGISSQTEW